MSSIAVKSKPPKKWMEFRVLVGQHIGNDPDVEAVLAGKTVPELVQIIRDRGIIHHPNLDLTNKEICLKLLRDNGAMQVKYSPETGWFKSTVDLCSDQFQKAGMRPKFERRNEESIDVRPGETREQFRARKAAELAAQEAEMFGDEGTPDFGSMTAPQLQEYARTNGIDLKGAKTPEQMVKVIQAASLQPA